MKQRCLNSKNKDYRYYGARGIKVCDRWRYSFKNFLADMGYKPGNTLWIARIMTAIMNPRIADGPRVKSKIIIRGDNKLIESKRCGAHLHVGQIFSHEA
jgi:hypothetical protein